MKIIEGGVTAAKGFEAASTAAKDLATARTQQMRQQKLLELMQTVY